MTRYRSSLLLLAALALSACKEKAPDAAPTVVTAASTPAPASMPAPAAPATDKWLGKWNGPEGTFLNLAGAEGKYQVTVQNLDGPATFPGTAAGDTIAFERSGIKETIRAGSGADTGMKWLSEKKDCLVVKPGEGYCRD